MGYDTDIKISLEGKEELNAIINRVDKKVRKKLLVKVFRQSAKPLVKEAKRLAPKSHKKSFIVAHGDIRKKVRYTRLVTHRAGELKRSIGVIVGKGPVASVFIGPRKGGIKANDGWYAHFVEFGTVKQKAQPFMRPAWDKTNKEIESQIYSGVEKAVEEEVKKGGKV